MAGDRPCLSPEVSATALAYVGDALFTLWVRTYYVRRGPAKQRELHRLCSGVVRAGAQAQWLGLVEDMLAEEEKSIVRWARNAKIGKGGGGTSAERHLATGFEALLGYLYLTGQTTRLDSLLSFVVEHAAQPGGQDIDSDPAQTHS